MPLKPKNLILNLLLAAEGPLSSREAVGSCGLFGIRENSVRVTLVRLAAAGLIEAAGRGSYRLGPQAVSLAKDLSRWRTLEQRLREWDGGWLMVSTGTLGRSDRVALRARERALALNGFRPLDGALYVRPDNLVGHAQGVRERLHALGLDAEAPVFVARDLDAELERAARSLWDGKALTDSYRHTQQRLQAWAARADELDLDVAARECYLLGHEAIRQLVFDPMLPAPLVDEQARHEFIAAVQDFDRLGHGIWQRQLAQFSSPARKAGVDQPPASSWPSTPVH